ncbi:hypothetical protein ACM1RC_32615 [Paenibacillus azoreducens]|uniref:hypothetical protein n=1 Tax=Paenibacillus azoreducens TaxID=116718 RepID=UPI0039F5FD08
MDFSRISAFDGLGYPSPHRTDVFIKAGCGAFFGFDFDPERIGARKDRADPFLGGASFGFGRGKRLLLVFNIRFCDLHGYFNRVGLGF